LEAADDQYHHLHVEYRTQDNKMLTACKAITQDTKILTISKQSITQDNKILNIHTWCITRRQ